MARQKLSVLIPTRNEARNIVACATSARFADEVVVVDSFSDDETLALARPIADRVLEHEYINSATQKNWAIPQMAHEWVMVLDADERITPELRDEIARLLASGPRHDAYRIWRRNHFLGREVRYCGWQNDSVVRLFRRDRCRYQDREVHADIECDGSIGALEGRLLHYTFESFDQYMKKFDRYTRWAAGDRAKRTRRVRWHHLTARPAFRFFKQYVLKRGFLDGMTGVIVCGLAAFSVFMKYARLYERELAADASTDGDS